MHADIHAGLHPLIPATSSEQPVKSPSKGPSSKLITGSFYFFSSWHQLNPFKLMAEFTGRNAPTGWLLWKTLLFSCVTRSQLLLILVWAKSWLYKSPSSCCRQPNRTCSAVAVCKWICYNLLCLCSVLTNGTPLKQNACCFCLFFFFNKWRLL